MSSHPFILSLLSLCLVLATHAQEEAITMRGLVELKAPYAERDYSTGKIKGFYVDLLNELALIGKFSYTLIEANSTTENKTPRNQFNQAHRQLVSDIYSQADFALSDKFYKGNHITARHLLLTDNYLVSGFSALVAKERLKNYGVSSLEELFGKNRVRATKDPEDKGLALGSVANSNTYTELSLSSNKNIGRRIYEWLYLEEEKKFVDTREKGIQQVRDKPFALIELGLDNELTVDDNCDLTALPISFVYANGTKEGVVREYGIAVQKTSSRNLEILNKGIRELKINGKLNELKRRYWNRKCNDALYDNTHYVINSMYTLFSLGFSFFLLS